MASSLKSFPKSQRKSVALRRLKNRTGGLSYWGAHDAVVHIQDDEKKTETPETEVFFAGSTWD